MAVESFHVDIYMWESMGQRDRSVRLAELPLQQRRMLPKSISTPLPPVAPAGAWSAGGIEAISPIISNRSMRSYATARRAILARGNRYARAGRMDTRTGAGLAAST
jgi:hypothetical protein